MLDRQRRGFRNMVWLTLCINEVIQQGQEVIGTQHSEGLSVWFIDYPTPLSGPPPHLQFLNYKPQSLSTSGQASSRSKLEH